MSVIAVIGGTGPQGKGLAYRFARGGHEIVLGSRDQERAVTAAAELGERVPSATVRGARNDQAAEAADLVLLAVPYDGHDALVAELAPHLAGKVVISCVNPIGFDKRGPYGLDLGPTSAAEDAQRLLPESRVIGAFHHLSAVSLNGSADLLDHEDVLVCGDDPDAKAAAIELAATVTGRPGIDAGALRMARQLEPLTAVLISINKRYKVRSGILVAGLDPAVDVTPAPPVRPAVPATT
ncbi:NADPH-dependent F420 reductase [Nocardioides immobilis]|uniref:NADPH-dependent F420 reductase n=1 Tax=Nocardioides immobilis TaxID=2049295 RepID=A0A417XU82_9ACTN|nr:NADPH-dependent F420 reductase [Nocardioides immobilis]RHW23903.1 NADPH-dependent F420 reductase [Nocardioides immobilis]